MTDTAFSSIEPGETHTSAHPRLGWIVAWNSQEGPRVDFPGNHNGPLNAETTIFLTTEIAQQAIETKRKVMLLFDNNDETRPVIIGLVQGFGDSQHSSNEVRIDGRRLEIEGYDEVVLRSGSASITLRRNGRVVLRGSYVESRSKGANRVAGGSVHIN